MHEEILGALNDLEYAYDKIDEVIDLIRGLGFYSEADQIARNAERAYVQATALLDEHVGEA